MTDSGAAATEPRYDVVVVGAGFGGLGAALSLAERGARVLVCEALNYPGGCAGTYRRNGYRFESGATLLSGLGEGQLFRRWIDRHALDVTIDGLDPVVEFRAPGLTLPVSRRREALIERLAAWPDAPRAGLSSFFAEQRRVAGVLWRLLDDPGLLPPFTARSLLTHLRRSPAYLALLPHLGRSLGDVLRRHHLHDFPPLRAYLDGLCQITVQCSADESEAPFALAAMDYHYRGTGHVRGGIGHLATGLAQAIGRAGGTVQMADAVRRLERTNGGWRVIARRGTVWARSVIANVLPQALPGLLGDGAAMPSAGRRAAEALESGWGAVMLFRVVTPPAGEAASPHHLQLVADPRAPFQEGNHLFASISGPHDAERAPEGQRTITMSTHIPMRRLRALNDADQAAYVEEVLARMRRTFADLAPAWAVGTLFEDSASPRTFERFTRRPFGYVGGVPRRTGLHHYLDLFSSGEMLPGLFLTGDTMFPGQSTLAAAIGGTRVAERVLARG